MAYWDLPYYEGMRAKTCREYKLHENKHENYANPFHNLVLDVWLEKGWSFHMV